MKFWKRSILLLLALVMTLSFVGCAPSSKTSEPAETPVAEAPTEETKPEEGVVEEKATWPVLIKDHLGREVTIEEKPEKLVSGYYITSSMLIALGLEDNLVGIEAKADSRPIYSLAAPQLLDLPNVGSAKEFNLEGTVALEPDLVILPIKLKDAVQSLQDLGITVIAVNPEDMDLLKETLTMIGKATGTEEKAEELINYYDEKIGELAKIATEDKRVYLGGNSAFLSTATGKMYQNFMIESAGAKNVAAAIEDTYWATISYEQLLAYDPDVIVVVPEAEYTKEDILKDEKLAPIKAVEKGEIYIMPDSFEAWDSPVPSGILGTMWLASVLNEEAYPFETFKSDVSDFYERFYDFKVESEKITK
ncbi:ABC transporter substrate-binding protein [Tissierella creatinini]|nr:ABC transporter substrate-binding protein [Tissierella creatinini]TJX59639.1 ABC transporter substrate-binding protein [Soehngenia saccharolytica]